MSEDLIKRDSVIKILHMIDEKLGTEQCDDKAKQCMYECAREMLSILRKAINAIPSANEEYVRFSDVAKALDEGMCTSYDCDIVERIDSISQTEREGE